MNALINSIDALIFGYHLFHDLNDDDENCTITFFEISATEYM